MKLQLDYGEPTFTLTSDGRLELVHDFLYSGGDPEERKSWTRAEARQAVKSLVMALDGWKADGEKGIGL